VTGPTTPMGEQGAVAQQFVEDANKLWVTAAEQSDSTEGLGIDGRIALAHGLVDLWVKGWVAWLEAVIKGGGAFFPGSSAADTPLPSEVVEVTARTYPRKIECDGPFVRIGLPKITIPPAGVAFDPPFLPAGLTRIRIILKDTRFIGSNFTGKIKLTSTATTTTTDAAIVPDEKVVTVGL
jgi:hypothetical protein